MDIERDIKDICETLRDEELYTEAMAIEEIIEIKDARIRELKKALEWIDIECMRGDAQREGICLHLTKRVRAKIAETTREGEDGNAE